VARQWRNQLVPVDRLSVRETVMAVQAPACVSACLCPCCCCCCCCCRRHHPSGQLPLSLINGSAPLLAFLVSPHAQHDAGWLA
jgi:hypothetical protein